MENRKLFGEWTLLKFLVFTFWIILIGCICILFSLQINNWNNNRQSTEKELRVVRDIVADLNYYSFLREYGGGRMKEVIAAAEQLLSAIRDPKVQLSKKEIDFDLHKLTWIWLSATPTTKYVALNSSGDFSYISSMPLRNKFSQFGADQEKLLQFEAIQARFVDQQLRPFLNQKMDRTTIDSYQSGRNMDTQQYPSPFTNTNYELLQNREFANLLIDLLFFTKRLFLPYDRMEDRTTEMRELIKKEYPSIEQSE